MSITCELREYARIHQPYKSELYNAHVADEIIAIADGIDAEHEKALAEQFDSLTVDMKPMTDENMAEGGWMRMPVCADGEYIHIGDVMEWVQYDETNPSVVREVAAVGVDVFFAWDKTNKRYAQYEAHAYRHYHEPTVEDALRELCVAYMDTPFDDSCDTEFFAKYADLIRKVVEHE